jgi:hypothetical protein
MVFAEIRLLLELPANVTLPLFLLLPSSPYLFSFPLSLPQLLLPQLLEASLLLLPSLLRFLLRFAAPPLTFLFLSQALLGHRRLALSQDASLFLLMQLSPFRHLASKLLKLPSFLCMWYLLFLLSISALPGRTRRERWRTVARQRNRWRCWG